MLIEALFTIARIWKQPKCPSLDELIEKLWYKYTMDYHSAIKIMKILPFATTWIDLGGIMLSEFLNQTKKDNYHMISLVYRI